MKKAKVLYVIESLNNGGTEKVMINYIYNMNRSRVDVEIMFRDPNFTYYLNQLETDGYKVYCLKGTSAGRDKYYEELNTFFASHKYDAVHIHALYITDLSIAYFAKRNGSKSVLYHAHISKVKNNLRHRLFKTVMGLVVDYKIACSRVAGEHMFGRKYNIFNNAIDVGNYLYSEDNRTEIREKYGIADRQYWAT